MTRQSPSRRPAAHRALVSCLALAAIALGLAPSGQAVSFADSFESWPGVWWDGGTAGNQIAAMRPLQDGPSTKAVGAWDGTKALKIVYGGSVTSNRAEAISSIGGPFQDVALRMMVYVPSSTVTSMAAGQEVQIARLMSIPSAPADIALYLVRGSNSLFVRGVYYGGIVGPTPFGGASTTDLAPDTWHTIEVAYQEVALVGANLDLYVDDLTTPRATAGGLATLLGSIGAVAVGLTGDVALNSTQPLVWWIDDVAAGPDRLGHGSPRFHFHQDGYEVTNVSSSVNPAGKSLVANGAGNVKQVRDAGHRDGGMQVDDGDTSGLAVSAAYGELTGYDAGIGKVFHRVWWHQGPSTTITGTSHPLVGIGGKGLGSVAPLDNPMVAISVKPGNYSLVVWGFSIDAGVPWRDPEVGIAGPPLDAGWHLLEVEVAFAGTAGGQRLAWVDGRALGSTSANWPGVYPTQWIDGHLPDRLNKDYTGRDDYDDSRTSLFPQASKFGLDITAILNVGACTPITVQALDSNDGPAPPAEDVLVAYDAYGAGAFYADPTCSTASFLGAGIPVPAGVTAVTTYFLPMVPGPATVTLGAPDHVPHDTSFTIASVTTVDQIPPTTPGQPVPSRTVTNSAVLVEWRGSHDDGGSGLARYEVEASPNDGGWGLWTTLFTTVQDVDAGFAFDAGEAYWKLRVRAVDGAGNFSDAGRESPSIAVDRTNPTPPPAAPVAALIAGGTTATVSWPAANDPGQVPSGVRAYVLHVVKTPGGTSVDYGQPETFRDIPVSPGYTYTMTVTASDNAGNISGPSEVGTLIYPGPTAGLRLLGLSSSGPDAAYAVAGVNYPVTVEAVDSARNVNPGYGGAVVFGAVTGTGVNASATLPLDGGAYRFVPADQGRHGFDPGFTFNVPGDVTAGVTDTTSAQLSDRVQVTVISPGQVRIIHDANPVASDGVPYLYSSLGAVRAVSSDPVTFSTCDSPPSEFLLDPPSGAVRWIPSQGNNWPVSLCVRATASGSGATDEYRFSVFQLPSSGQQAPVARFSVTPSATGTGALVLFDPTASSWDPDLAPPSYRWRSGDGSPLIFRPQPPHAYLLPGGYRPALTLFDAIGQSDQTKREVRINDLSGRVPPSLLIQTQPPVGDNSLAASLQATVAGGSSPAGAIRWDLGNGSFADGANVTGDYPWGRTWATAMAVDGNGLPATDKLEIAVNKDGKVPPFCVAAVDPPVAVVPATGRAQVNWIAWRSAGTKPLASVSWSIDGVPTPGGMVSREYSTPGWRRGTLTVTDEEGLTCTDSVALLVLAASPTTSTALPPRILDPGVNGGIDCTTAYAGRPALASGTPPLTWSLASPSQASLAIDASTGAVSWSPPILPGVDRVSYTLIVQGPGATDQVPVTITYTCRRAADLKTRCGCGEGGGGVPALAGLLMLSLWVAARRRSGVLVRSRRR